MAGRHARTLALARPAPLSPLPAPPRQRHHAQAAGEHRRCRRLGNRRHRIELERVDRKELAAARAVDDALPFPCRVAIAEAPGERRVEPVVHQQVGSGAEGRSLVDRVEGLEGALARQLEGARHLAVDGRLGVIEQEGGAAEVARRQMPAVVGRPALRVIAAHQPGIACAVGHPQQREGRALAVGRRMEVDRIVAGLARVQVGEHLVAGAEPAFELAFQRGIEWRRTGLPEGLWCGKGQRERASGNKRLHDHLLTGFTDDCMPHPRGATHC
jgi:hypothetical protein